MWRHVGPVQKDDRSAATDLIAFFFFVQVFCSNNVKLTNLNHLSSNVSVLLFYCAFIITVKYLVNKLSRSNNFR